jgi:para-aminobenzoate synthetase component I
MDRPFVLIEGSGAGGDALLFEHPVALFTAQDASEVGAALTEMQRALRRGLHLAGYAAYELGHVLEGRLAPSLRRPRTPLLRFGAFAAPRTHVFAPMSSPPPAIAMTPAWNFADYQVRFRRVIDYIRAGDVYQINLTFPLRGRFDGDALALYAALRRRQPAVHGGVVALGPETVLSLSPELFFATRGRAIRARPMKGTAQRGTIGEEDAFRAAALRTSEKDRAENLMIVDLLRNDLGRLAEIGSVRVSDLFTIETYPTLHQMTSGVEARLRAGVALAELFAGLFPCGSVTGAPKIRAMEIIRELEDFPRDVYCGTLGHVAPDGDMRFNVAIRTATLYPGGELVCNVGSAVVHDSEAEAEYDECLLKATFLTGRRQASA